MEQSLRSLGASFVGLLRTRIEKTPDGDYNLGKY